MPRAAVAGRTGAVQIGVRPEKIRIGGDEPNVLSGKVAESAYIGVSTQYIVDTAAGAVTVYVQNDRPGRRGASPGDRLTLGWSPECTFVVEAQEEFVMIRRHVTRKMFLGRAAAGGALLTAPGLFAARARPRVPRRFRRRSRSRTGRSTST